MATLLYELGKDTAELTASSTLEGAAMRLFLVQTTSTERATDAVGAVGLPRVNVDSHPANIWMLCKSKKAERLQGSKTLWTVTASYDTAAEPVSGGANGPSGDAGNDPLTWEADVDVTYENQEYASAFDANNEPYSNTAGQAFEGGMRRVRVSPIVRYTQYEPITVDVIDKCSQYANTRNASDFIKTGDAGQWLCRSISATKVRVSGQLSWRVSYEFAYDTSQQFHRTQVANIGPKYLDGAQLKPFKDIDNQPYEGNLDIDGTALAVGDNPLVLYFQPYESKEWTPLKVRKGAKR